MVLRPMHAAHAVLSRRILAGSWLLSLAFAACWPMGARGVEKPPARPNVLLFITDDESWQERSLYGWSKLPTPHFDRVARDGVLFTRGYTSAPSCAPSRAALLTGRNFWELEEGAFIQAWLPSKFDTLPDLLESAGYHAGYTGKGWGPGLLPESGRKRNPAGTAYNSVKREPSEPGIGPMDYAGNLRAFLAAKPAGKPFFFWVGAIEPHTPCDARNFQRLEKDHAVGLEAVTVPGFLPDTPGIRRARANMLYEVCHADADLGRVLELLREHGALSNTLVIVTADNGTQVLRSKANIYDWGLHVPMAMMWPARVTGGRRVDDFVHFADIAPTVLVAADIPVPKTMSGRSALDVLQSKTSGRVDPARSWTVGGLEWHGELPPYDWSGRTIRDERYQYIVNYSTGPRRALSAEKRLPDEEYGHSAATASESGLLERHPEHPAVKAFVPLLAGPRPREELYDCEADPWQLHNLADDPAHVDTKARLKNRLEAYQRQTGDPRITGDLALFERTRALVQERKRKGYRDE